MAQSLSQFRRRSFLCYDYLKPTLSALMPIAKAISPYLAKGTHSVTAAMPNHQNSTQNNIHISIDNPVVATEFTLIDLPAVTELVFSVDNVNRDSSPCPGRRRSIPYCPSPPIAYIADSILAPMKWQWKILRLILRDLRTRGRYRFYVAQVL